MNIDKDNNLVWIDLEMTGIDVNKDAIIEIAVIITDRHLNVVKELEPIAIYQCPVTLEKMSPFVRNMHTKNGLIKRVKASTCSVEEAEAKVLDFIKQYVAEGKSPLCGNSIHQDRYFMMKYMPKIIDYVHYRNIDVSTLKELARVFGYNNKFKKAHNNHLALEDIRGSIAELKFFRQNIMKI